MHKCMHYKNNNSTCISDIKGGANGRPVKHIAEASVFLCTGWMNLQENTNSFMVLISQYLLDKKK